VARDRRPRVATGVRRVVVWQNTRSESRRSSHATASAVEGVGAAAQGLAGSQSSKGAMGMVFRLKCVPQYVHASR